MYIRRGVGTLITALLCLLWGPADPVSRQAVSLDELIKANSYSLRVSNAELEGPGRDFLTEATERTQFFVIGEEHVVTEIPEFTTALFALLHARHGYNYLALELDPVMGRKFSERGIAGNRSAVGALARRYPNGTQFVTDQELRMIADVAGRSAGRGNRIWGCDQIFGALHALERLEVLAQSRDTRNEIRLLVEEAREYEGERFRKNIHYMYANMKPERVRALEKFYNAKKSTEEEFLLSQLRISAEIYSTGGYESNRQREENMKDLFMLEYRNAQALGDRVPKAVLKLGHWHTYRGFGPNRISTLGDFAAQFSKSNGMDSFHVAIFVTGPPDAWRSIAKDADLRPLADAVTKEGWTVVDFRPMRRHIYSGRIKGIAPKLQNYIFGFDAALLMTGATPATYELIKTPGFRDWPED